MAVVVGDRKGVENTSVEVQPTFICDEDDQSAGTILLSLGAMGIGANVALMTVILLQKPLRS
jgi:hypothetical protein